MNEKIYTFTDDKEKVLWYLLHKKREDNNIVALGTDRYKDIEGIEPERFVQILVALQDARYVDLDFRGHVSHRSFCYVKLRDSALSYFENQEITEEKELESSGHDYNVEISGAVVGAVLAAIFAILLLFVESTLR